VLEATENPDLPTEASHGVVVPIHRLAGEVFDGNESIVVHV
jgi:hypothetical protein